MGSSPIDTLEEMLGPGKGLKRKRVDHFESLREKKRLESLGILEVSHEGEYLRAELMLERDPTRNYLEITRDPEGPPTQVIMEQDEGLTYAILSAVGLAQIEARRFREEGSLTISSTIGKGAKTTIYVAMKLIREREERRREQSSGVSPSAAEENPLENLRSSAVTYRPGNGVGVSQSERMKNVPNAEIRDRYQEATEHGRLRATYEGKELTVRRVTYEHVDTGETLDVLHVSDNLTQRRTRQLFLRSPGQEDWVSQAFARVAEEASGLEERTEGYSCTKTPERAPRG